jgi:hypothetical protein
MMTFDRDVWLTPSGLRHLAKLCRGEGGETGPQVAGFLDRIRSAEQLLAPSVSLFAYLLGSDGQPVNGVAESVRKQWGPSLRTVDLKALEAIESELVATSGEAESARRWLGVAGGLAEGDYTGVITHLIDQNSEVMSARGGAAPWLEIRDGRLHVKFVAEAGSLPTKEELPTHWVHPYFLDSLRTVAKELQA